MTLNASPSGRRELSNPIAINDNPMVRPAASADHLYDGIAIEAAVVDVSVVLDASEPPRVQSARFSDLLNGLEVRASDYPPSFIFFFILLLLPSDWTCYSCGACCQSSGVWP